jgi:4-hydroxy-2-oxoheptanedioate aldolase
MRQLIADLQNAESWVHASLRLRMQALPGGEGGGTQATAAGCGGRAALLCSGKYQHCAVFCPSTAMPPVNHFKRALQAGQAQIGLWSTLPSPYVSELIAGAGFDWVLLDTEHTPTDVPQMLQQLQAVAAARPREGLGCSHAVVRPAWNDKVLIKRYLDIGAQTLLLPFVQNADEARAAVEAVRYAPQGLRGMGGSMRASNFGRDADYVAKAADEICLLVQVETGEALDNLEAIASVDGIDGVFIGPADLSASLGYPGNAGHPDMEATIDRALVTIRACGKAPGILAVNPDRAQACLDKGALFVAVGMDMLLLRQSADALALRFKRPGDAAVSASMY